MRSFYLSQVSLEFIYFAVKHYHKLCLLVYWYFNLKFFFPFRICKYLEYAPFINFSFIHLFAFSFTPPVLFLHIIFSYFLQLILFKLIFNPQEHIHKHFLLLLFNYAYWLCHYVLWLLLYDFNQHDLYKSCDRISPFLWSFEQLNVCGKFHLYTNLINLVFIFTFTFLLKFLHTFRTFSHAEVFNWISVFLPLPNASLNLFCTIVVTYFNSLIVLYFLFLACFTAVPFI